MEIAVVLGSMSEIKMLICISKAQYIGLDTVHWNHLAVPSDDNFMQKYAVYWVKTTSSAAMTVI